MKKIFGSLNNFRLKLGKWFWVILAVFLIIVWRIIASANASTKVQVTQVVSGDLIESVSTSGTVKADQYSVLTFPSGGLISWVGVKTGQKVVKGQAIAQIDAISLNALYQQALNNYRNYQAAADNVLDSVKNHSTDETFLQKSTRTTAEVNRDNAYNSVLSTQDNLRNAIIHAPFAGIIDTVIPSSPGINTLPGWANYTIVNPDSTYFDAEVGETDLIQIMTGQKVDIKLDAYPDETFKGTLANIGMVAFTSSTGGNSYHIRISLPKNETATGSGNFKFRVGMQGDADIILTTVSDVLKVSTTAVVSDGGQNYVWIIENGRAKKIEITIGGTSIDELEIKSGLSKDQEVIDNPASTLKQNQKVSK